MSVGERCPEAELPTKTQILFLQDLDSRNAFIRSVRTSLRNQLLTKTIHATLHGPFAKLVCEGVIPFPSTASSVDWVDLSGHWLCSFLKRWRGAWVTRVVKTHHMMSWFAGTCTGCGSEGVPVVVIVVVTVPLLIVVTIHDFCLFFSFSRSSDILLINIFHIVILSILVSILPLCDG